MKGFKERVQSGNLNYNDLAYIYNGNGAYELGAMLATGEITQCSYDYAWKCVNRGF